MRFVGFCLLVWATSVFACDEQLLRQASSPNEVWQILDPSEQSAILSAFGGDQVKALAAIEMLAPRLRELAKHVETLDDWSAEFKAEYRKLVATTVLSAIQVSTVTPPPPAAPPSTASDSLFAQDEILKSIYDLNTESLQFQNEVFRSGKLHTLLERFWLVERDVKQYGQISRTNMMMLIASPLFEFEQELATYVTRHAELKDRTEALIQDISTRIESLGPVEPSNIVLFQKKDLLIGAKSTMDLLLLQLVSLQHSLSMLETPVQDVQELLVGSLASDAKITSKTDVYVALDGLKKVANR